MAYCLRRYHGIITDLIQAAWARYPADLGHNFVLAHRRCNLRKSDHLAAEEHLAAWVERNETRAGELEAGFGGPDPSGRSVSVRPVGESLAPD